MAVVVTWAATPLAADNDAESCRVTLEVETCSGEAIADVTVAIEVGDDRREAVTDDEGRAIFEVCADQIGDVLVYLIEGGEPLTVSPWFEDDDSSSKHKKARVSLC